MPKGYRAYLPEQDLLLPPSRANGWKEDHLVYFVSDVVDQLDLSAIHGVYQQEQRGQPPYDPRLMTKLLVYGDCTGVFSSRRTSSGFATISDWGHRLCKCRYCGLYFMHPKPRQWYKHGTFCGDHQMSWSATGHVKGKRRIIHAALLDIAARALMKRRVNGPHWQDNKQRKVPLACR